MIVILKSQIICLPPILFLIYKFLKIEHLSYGGFNFLGYFELAIFKMKYWHLNIFHRKSHRAKHLLLWATCEWVKSAPLSQATNKRFLISRNRFLASKGWGTNLLVTLSYHRAKRVMLKNTLKEPLGAPLLTPLSSSRLYRWGGSLFLYPAFFALKHLFLVSLFIGADLIFLSLFTDKQTEKIQLFRNKFTGRWKRGIFNAPKIQKKKKVEHSRFQPRRELCKLSIWLTFLMVNNCISMWEGGRTYPSLALDPLS